LINNLYTYSYDGEVIGEGDARVGGFDVRGVDPPLSQPCQGGGKPPVDKI